MVDLWVYQNYVNAVKWAFTLLFSIYFVIKMQTNCKQAKFVFSAFFSWIFWKLISIFNIHCWGYLLHTWCNFVSIFGTHFKLFADISDEIVFMFRMMKIQEPGGLSAASLKWRFSHIVFPIIVGLYGNVLSTSWQEKQNETEIQYD